MKNSQLEEFGLLERNSKMGIAMYLVADIFERLRSTSGSRRIIASLISSVQIVNALTHKFDFLDCKPTENRKIVDDQQSSPELEQCQIRLL